MINKNIPIVYMVHGSYLYGLNTPKSDQDFKGVYAPSLLHSMKHGPINELRESTGTSESKNGSGDIDRVAFSIEKFIRMCEKNDMVAMDMLHADLSHCIYASLIWKFLREKRHIFYSKNITGYMGYVDQQVNRYGIIGSRVHTLDTVVNMMKIAKDVHGDKSPLFNVNMPELDHVHYSTDRLGNKFYEVCGKKYNVNDRLDSVLSRLEKRLSEVNQRKEDAEQDIGIDWKAVSHAFRCLYQLGDIGIDGDIQFPLQKSRVDFLKELKNGEHSWVNIKPLLEDTRRNVYEIIRDSNLPDEVDRGELNKFRMMAYNLIYTGV